MKVVILAGGQGRRLREAAEAPPKPLVRIGAEPILWHIMQIYALHGFRDFIICLGYKGDEFRDYFLNYRARHSDFTVELGSGAINLHNGHDEHDWRVTLAETGLQTATGGRLRRIKKYLQGETFMATYGDGVASVNLAALLEFHRRAMKLATLTAVRPASRFGELSISGGLVQGFREKPPVQPGWINGGFLVLEPAALDLIEGDDEVLESGLLARLADQGALAAYQHVGFWQCMDTPRERQILNGLWQSGNAPWALWRK